MSEQRKDKDGVVRLVDAGVPADQGLSSLGLLMQLAGNVFAVSMAFVVFSLLADENVRRSGVSIWLFLLLGGCIGRSMMHRSAGATLLYGNGTIREDGNVERMAGVRHYIIASIVQVALFAAIMKGKFDLPGKLVIGMSIAQLLWPATLAILMQLPRFKRFSTDVPMPEDKGFEGASILMTVLGLCGVVFAGAMVMMLLELPGKALQKGGMMLIVVAAVMLVIRSALHAHAGISGLRETSVDKAVDSSNRYANFGVISAFCAGGAMLIMLMSSKGTASPFGIGVVTMVVWILMAWPLTIRRFFSDRQFADLLAGDDAQLHRRAPDAGLTGLGWLLFGAAIMNGSMLVIGFFLEDNLGSRIFEALSLFAAPGGGFRSIWWTVGVTVLQGWAGYELIRMSPQSRVIASLFGVIGTAATLYVNWPFLKFMKSLGASIGGENALQLSMVLMALSVQVVTLVLVNRKIAPTARARFRRPAHAPAAAPPTQA